MPIRCCSIGKRLINPVIFAALLNELMPKHFKQYDELDLPKVADEVLKQWDAEDTFGQSLELRKDAPPVVFYE